MEVTEALILAVEMGAGDIESTVTDCIAELAAKQEAPAPYLLRLLEEKRQAADVLLGWAARARKVLGLPQRQ